MALAARFGAEGRFLAGGTDLLVQLQRGRLRPRHVIALHRVPGLTGIDVNGGIELGACVTPRAIERTAAFAGSLRALMEGAEVIGGHQVRNVATVGGNLANASPAADLTPCLLVLDARVIFEHRFTTSVVHQGYTEPRAAVASWESSGQVTVWSNTQLPFDVQNTLAEILAIAPSKIRVIVPGIGGAFGGKLRVGVEHFAALLARASGRSVKVMTTSEEELTAAYPLLHAL